MPLTVCPHCKKHQEHPNQNHCPYCGTNLSGQYSNPNMCGHRLHRSLNDPHFKFCFKCGVNMKSDHGWEAVALMPMI